MPDKAARRGPGDAKGVEEATAQTRRAPAF
jgi:hypothetical protein